MEVRFSSPEVSDRAMVDPDAGLLKRARSPSPNSTDDGRQLALVPVAAAKDRPKQPPRRSVKHSGGGSHSGSSASGSTVRSTQPCMYLKAAEAGEEVAAGGLAPGGALVNVPVEILEGGQGGSAAPFTGVFKAGTPAQGKGISTPRAGRGAGGQTKVKPGLGGGGEKKKSRGSKAPVVEKGVSGEEGSRREGGSPSGGKPGKGGGGGMCCGPEAVKIGTTGASKKGGSPGRAPRGGKGKDSGVLGSSPKHPAGEDVTSSRMAGADGGRGRSRGSPGQGKGKEAVGSESPAGGRPGVNVGSWGASGSPSAGARRTLLSGVGSSAQAAGGETRVGGPSHGELVSRFHQAIRREGGEEESCTRKEGGRSPPLDKCDP